ncbi:MAG TPA: hypothetical protein VJ650_12320 [Gemmatimonadaceae bacterium]|nr:hypothetical protein [Gemmatimonadaceae bacterium]
MVPREREPAFKRRLTWFWGAYFVALMPTLYLGGWIHLLALVVVATIIYYIVLWTFMRQLPVADRIPALNRRAAIERTSTATGRPFLWASLIASLLFVVAGVWFITMGEGSVGWMAVGFFGLAALSIGVQLRAAYRASKAPRN